MYFHPLILTEAQKQQRLAAWEDITRVCLAGIERQHRWHAQAFNELYERHQECGKAMLEALHLVHELASWSALAARMPLQLLPISMRSAEVAADLHRKIGAVAGIYVSSPPDVAEGEPLDRTTLQEGAGGLQRSRPHRQQVMG